jgi:hypothetical protein
MKKILIFSSAILISGLALGKGSLNSTEQDPKGNPVSTTIPPDVYKIIGGSCVDCHAKGGKKSAMSHVNFSEWDSYAPAKKATKAGDMVKMLQKGKMPPKMYKESHPGSIPTPDQIETIAKWAGSLPKK